MNLITSRWLPSLAATGARALDTPAGVLADEEGEGAAFALDLPRPDWNAAIREFLIGLTAVAFAPADEDEWQDRWHAPPRRDELEKQFGQLAFAFAIDGEGARAFQDLDPLDSAEAKLIDQMLIDAPGAIAFTKNTDFFQKRGRTPALCLGYAAAALITLQTYAPSGGAGHRTSMRGGGPLTTVVYPPANEAPSLWHQIWANVPLVTQPLPSLGARPELWGSVFPWLAATNTSEKGQIVGPDDGHPLLAFFATPRRIRMSIEPEGECALGGDASQGVVATYRTKNYGANYTSWRHPLSPYREDKKSGLLPLHPRADGMTYRDWLGLWPGLDEAAVVVREWQRRAVALDEHKRRFDIAAFGYATDNMKAEAWVEARIPAFVFQSDKEQERFFGTARRLVDAAVEASRRLGYADRLARFGAWSQKDSAFRIPDQVKLDTSAPLNERFWRQSESDFLERLHALIETDALDDPTQDHRKAWRGVLRDISMRLFDDIHQPAESHVTDLKRLIFARSFLLAAFSESGTAKSAPVTAALTLTQAKATRRAA